MAWWREAAAQPCGASREAAQQRQLQLTKPPGSLGRLEELAVQFAAWQGRALPQLQDICIRVFAADHGVAREGVSAFPQAVTVEMIRNFSAGGAAIAVLARQWRADFGVVNLGTALPVPALPQVQNLDIAPGTANFCDGPAMTPGQCERALAAGAQQLRAGCHLFIGGEMGIGNTTAAAALTAALLGLPATATVGRGTGIDDAGLDRKRAVVARALALHAPHCDQPDEALRRLGGLEIAALAGAYIAAAQRGVPALVDGYICSAAALVACRMNRGVRDWLLFAHRSAEGGHPALLTALQAQPLLDLQLRLGEGSGAALALSLLRDACVLHAGMATFAEAGVQGGA